MERRIGLPLGRTSYGFNARYAVYKDESDRAAVNFDIVVIAPDESQHFVEVQLGYSKLLKENDGISYSLEREPFVPCKMGFDLNPVKILSTQDGIHTLYIAQGTPGDYDTPFGYFEQSVVLLDKLPKDI